MESIRRSNQLSRKNILVINKDLDNIPNKLRHQLLEEDQDGTSSRKGGYSGGSGIGARERVIPLHFPGVGREVLHAATKERGLGYPPPLPTHTHTPVLPHLERNGTKRSSLYSSSSFLFSWFSHFQ